MKKTMMDVLQIEKLYAVSDADKFLSLLEEVNENGWKNVPAIVVLENENGFFGITGSHRWEVAASLGIEIPVELYTEDEIGEIICRKDVDAEGWKALGLWDQYCENT